MENVLCCISEEEKSAFGIRLDIEKIGKKFKDDPQVFNLRSLCGKFKRELFWEGKIEYKVFNMIV